MRVLHDAQDVAERVDRRDLEALSTAGIPVYPQPGRGGGWSLLGGARTDLSGRTAPEAQALFLLLGPSASVVPEAKAGLGKLVRALPDTFRVDAQAATDAVVIDPARWAERDRPRPPLVDVLQRGGCPPQGRLTYSNRTREQTIRLIDPWGLADKDDVWYVVAGTRERTADTFRVDRVLEAVVTDLAAERPDSFALPQERERIVDEVEQRRGGVWATVLIGSGLLPVLRKQFGRQCEVDGRVEDGRVRVRVQAPTATTIAQHLAGWGALVEVAESETVQTELARIGAEPAERYRT